jgi:hypothetical protein
MITPNQWTDRLPLKLRRWIAPALFDLGLVRISAPTTGVN